MLYLVSEIPDNIAVERRISKWAVTKTISKQLLDGNVQNLLDVFAAEHYSKLLNISISANNPAVSGISLQENMSDILEKNMLLGDQCFCLLTPQVYADSSIPIKAKDKFVKNVEFFIYSGYFDQPLLDFCTYDYQNQIKLENVLVRNKLLEHTGYKKDFGKKAIETVTKSLKRLLRLGIIETTDKEYLFFKPNEKLLETHCRRKNCSFRLTGQPESGLFIPPCNVSVFCNPNQIPLF